MLAIERQLVMDGARSFWAICVTVAPGLGPLPQSVTQRGAGKAGKEAAVDYKQVLSEADFAVFSTLRSLRKTLAERDGVPLYAVLTNQQLAEIAQKRCASA